MRVFLMILAVLGYMAIGGAIYAVMKIIDSKRAWEDRWLDTDDGDAIFGLTLCWPLFIALLIPAFIARVMQIVITLIYAVITSIVYGGEDKG